MFIPGFGNVSTPQSTRQALTSNPGQRTAAREGILGVNAPAGAPGYNTPLNEMARALRAIAAGDTNTTTTNISQSSNEPVYSRVAKPLSADLVSAFGQRRLAADKAYQNALAQEESGIGRFKASFEASKQRLTEEGDRASQRLARQLAGRGLARSPMVRGRGEREMGQVMDSQLGEMKFNLATEIEGLKQASEMARIERENVHAQLAMEEAMARSNSFEYIRT